MTVAEFRRALAAQPSARLSFRLPDGTHVPHHFHVTEVGRIEKRFVDCGGVRREAIVCALQLWTADDLDHRLSAGKLDGILAMAAPLLESDELPVEVEYGAEVAATYLIEDATAAFGTLTFSLVGKRTQCLAWDRCGTGAGTGCC